MFTHGVASFDPGPDRVILWTAVSAPCTVHWEVAPDGADGDPWHAVAAGAAEATAAGPVRVDVDGLRPGTAYRYRFAAAGHHTGVGRTRTLPVGSVARWRLGVCCCADRSIHHFSAYAALAGEDVDLVLHLGDYIYESAGKGGRRLEPDRACVTLADYRARYSQARRDPGLQALHARFPMVAVWDDHDIADNAWRHGAKAHDPELHGPWEDRLRAAARARQEWLPARLEDPGDPLRLWRSVRAGDLAELVVADTRVDGRDQQAGDPGARPLDDPGRSLVGAAQRAWLRGRLADRSAAWCVLATQVTMSPMPIELPSSASLLDGAPSGYGVVEGRAVCTDEWDGYPAERERVAGAVADRGGGALVLSGDVHSAWAFDAGTAGRPGAGAPELVCPGVSSTPLGRQLPRSARPLADAVASTVGGARWFDLTSWGYLVLDISPACIHARFRLVDATRPAAPAVDGPAWVVDRDGTLRSDGPLPGPEEVATGARWWRRLVGTLRR